ncbi:MAG: hypothetical protein AAB425_03925 [Bdellovibrionota bacterium]
MRIGVKISQAAVFLTLTGIAGWLGVACSTTGVEPLEALPYEMPPFAKIPHPLGYDVGDVIAILNDPTAPPTAALQGCTTGFVKLRAMTRSADEIRQGAREFVRYDPVKTHWCYYQQISDLEKYLRTEAFVDLRQKKVLETYAYLAPIGRAFMAEFGDTRYLRWAIRRYKRLNEWVFFRRVEMSPKTTSELAEAVDPFQNVRPSGSRDYMVLQKYGLIPNGEKPVSPGSVLEMPPQVSFDKLASAVASPVPSPSPEIQPERSLASVASNPSPSPSPQPTPTPSLVPKLSPTPVPEPPRAPAGITTSRVGSTPVDVAEKPVTAQKTKASESPVVPEADNAVGP